MITCPMCQTEFSGYKCKCGWIAPKVSHHTHTIRDESVFSQYCRDWCDSRGITNKDMPRKARTEACKAYVKKMLSTPSDYITNPRTCFYELYTRMQDGEKLSHIQEKLTLEVMKMEGFVE